MLLMKLETREKFAFLQLSHFLARVDGNFKQREKDIINEYCSEMGIENSNTFLIEDFNLEENLNEFKSEKSKKIAILELMVLVHIDEIFDIKEFELTKKIMSFFKLKEEDLIEFSLWGKRVANLYKESKTLIEY